MLCCGCFPVETVLAWRSQVHPVLGLKSICREEEVRRRTVSVVTSIIYVCPCGKWCCYRNSASWKCPTVQFTKDSPPEVLISWEGVVIDSIIVYSVVFVVLELVESGNFSKRNSAGTNICILLTYVPLGSNMWDTSLLNSNAIINTSLLTNQTSFRSKPLRPPADRGESSYREKKIGEFRLHWPLHLQQRGLPHGRVGGLYKPQQKREKKSKSPHRWQHGRLFVEKFGDVDSFSPDKTDRIWRRKQCRGWCQLEELFQ